MSKTKLIRTLEAIFEFTESNRQQKIEELESLVGNLGTKVTTLTDEVVQLNERIVSLMTLQEELLYTFEQTDAREDNTPEFTVDFEEKKFGLN